MCNKLIILCVVLVVVASSMPALADVSYATPLLVDVNGDGGGGAKAGWQQWAIIRNWATPTSTTFTVGDPMTVTATLSAFGSGQNPPQGARSRDGGMAFVAGTGDFSAGTKGYGMNYLKLKLEGLTPSKEYEISLWSWEARGVWSADACNPNSKYVAWSTTNPVNWLVGNGWGAGGANTSIPNGGYGPINQPQPKDPLTALSDSNMPAGLAACVLPNGTVEGGRTSLIQETDPGDATLGTSAARTTFKFMTSAPDPDFPEDYPGGVAEIYGWLDATDWAGSAHVPLSGFQVVPEPVTVALLGLGGLALLRRKRA